MQSIINSSGFGFCKASGFRNCNNCLHRIKCINYIPIYSRNTIQTNIPEVLDLQSRQIFESNSLNKEETLLQENLALKHKVQDLENQISLLNNSKNIEQIDNKQTVEVENSSAELQVYQNKNLEISQQGTAPLKPKKGIFGTKYVEDNSKKK